MNGIGDSWNDGKGSGIVGEETVQISILTTTKENIELEEEKEIGDELNIFVILEKIPRFE